MMPSPRQPERAREEQREPLRLPRRLRVRAVLRRDRLLQRLQARRQHIGVAFGGVRRRLLVLLDGELRGVDLLLDLEIILGNVVARAVRGGVGVLCEDVERQQQAGTDRE
jgi:hypothetical protein